MEITLINSYSPPVDQLLACGRVGTLSSDKWPNYLEELGISSEHIPDLIRLATDEQLNTVDVEDCAEIWAPHHACRVLGQLHAEEAIEPLLSNLEMLQDSSDFLSEELPEVFAMIGPVALPKLAEYVANSTYNEWARICAITGIEMMGKRWPETRSECVKLLMAQLELFVENDYDINAFLILSLVKLQAIEAAPLIEQAFAADRVEEFVMGDWDDVQVRLGLKSAEEVKEKRDREQEEERLRRREKRSFLSFKDEEEAVSPSSGYAGASSQISRKASYKSEAARKNKAKSKMAKQSRTKNRTR